jgi:hypothetical protein
MSLKRSLPLLAGALAAVALAAPARAQLPSFTPFSFEARAGVAMPTGDLADVANTGYTLSGSATYHFIPMVGIYGGYTHSRFEVEGDEESGYDLVDSGFDLGARLAIPTPLIPIDPWIKGGLVFHKVSIEGDEIEEDDDSDSEMGFQVGAGLGFGIGPVSLTPGVSFISYKLDNEDDDDPTLSYWEANIGVRIRL